MTTSTNSWLDTLASERADLGRVSTAGRVAALLRERITEGSLPPGTRLSEEEIGSALGVSRNTLREAFRLLAHERLLIHEFNRGVFVRTFSAEDVRDLYQMRRILECGTVRAAGGRVPLEDLLPHISAAVDAGEAASRKKQWLEVGTANMAFHQALAALSGSPRVEEMMRQLLAELRLVFHVVDAPATFHNAYLGDNRKIVDLLDAGDLAGAETVLAAYLDTAEAQLVAEYDLP